MAANDIRAGRAYVEVYSKDNTMPGLRSAMNRIRGVISGVGRITAGAARFGASGASTILSGLGGAASAVAAGSAAAVASAVRQGSAVKDAADRTGMTYSAIQELGYAARQTGTDVEALETGIKFMQKAIASDDKALQEIGLSAAELARLPVDEQFMQVAKALGGIGNPAKQTAATVKVFGKSGTDLIPMLKEGADGIQRMRARAQELGIVMSDESVDAAEELGDRLEDLKERMHGLLNSVGVKLLPFVDELITVIDKAVPAFKQLSDAIADATDNAFQFQDGASFRTEVQDLFGTVFEMLGATELGQGMQDYAARQRNVNVSEANQDAMKREQARDERVRRAIAAANDGIISKSRQHSLVNGFGGQALNAAMSAQNVATKQLEEQKKANDELKRIEAAVKANKPVGFNFG